MKKYYILALMVLIAGVVFGASVQKYEMISFETLTTTTNQNPAGKTNTTFVYGVPKRVNWNHTTTSATPAIIAVELTTVAGLGASIGSEKALYSATNVTADGGVNIDTNYYLYGDWLKINIVSHSSNAASMDFIVILEQ